MSRDFEIIQMEMAVDAFKKLPNRQRHQLVGCMHAHNELVVLNRLLMFSLNDVGDGELHNDAHGVQMWSILQVLTGKLFETWDMIVQRILKAKPLSKDEIKKESRALEFAIRAVEKSPTEIPGTRGSTPWLIVSIFFLSKLWVQDPTSMSLHWIVRPWNPQLLPQKWRPEDMTAFPSPWGAKLPAKKIDSVPGQKYARTAMKILRYLILLASAGWLAAFLYAIWDDSRHGAHTPPWLVLIPASLVLNIVYVWSRPPTNVPPANELKNSRISRLFSLWLDAKEAELRDRAKRKD